LDEEHVQLRYGSSWSRAEESRVPRIEIGSSSGSIPWWHRLPIFTADQVDRKAALDPAASLVIPYPPSLFASHMHGVVLAEFVVDSWGRVEGGTFGVVAFQPSFVHGGCSSGLNAASHAGNARGQSGPAGGSSTVRIHASKLIASWGRDLRIPIRSPPPGIKLPND